MPIGLLGKKLGHTRVYDADGVMTPVTVVLVGPNRVLQVKKTEGDGYNAVQLGFDDQKEQRLSKAVNGHIKKHKGVAVKRIKEFRDFTRDVNDFGRYGRHFSACAAWPYLSLCGRIAGCMD